MKLPNTSWPILKAILAQFLLRLFFFAAVVCGVTLFVGAMLAAFSVPAPENLLENIFCLSGVIGISFFALAIALDKEAVEVIPF